MGGIGYMYSVAGGWWRTLFFIVWDNCWIIILVYISCGPLIGIWLGRYIH